MAIGNRLFALAEREFKANRATPVRQKFRGMKLKLSKLDEGWDHKRGAAVRMMGVVLRDSDTELYERVSASDQSVKTYSDAAAWLRREASLLGAGSLAALATLAGGYSRIRECWD